MRAIRWLGVTVVIVAIAVSALATAAGSFAWLGVRIRDLSEIEMDELASRHGIREGFGVFIVEIIDDTPAARAGLKGGDVIVALNARPVVDGRTLQRLIAAAPLDTNVQLTVLRTDGRHHLPIRLAPMPRAVLGERVAAEFGFVIRDPEPASAPTRPRVPSTTPALASVIAAVGAVIRGSTAEKAGLEVGDVILQVGPYPVPTRDAAREALAEVSPARPLSLTIRRGARQISLTLPPP
jgi:serine protease Do